MKWLHNLLRGVSLTGALFVFQACYGIPEPPLYEEGGEAPMSFSVVSKTTGEPIEGVTIRANPFNKNNLDLIGVTGADGKCKVMLPYRRNLEGPFIEFSDPDRNFIQKDTTLSDLRERDILIEMTPSL